MKILLVSSKYPPDYSGSGNRIHNTYLRLKKKFNIEFSVICSSTKLNITKTYYLDEIKCTCISKKILINSSIKKNKTIKALINRIVFWREFIFFISYFLRTRKKIDLMHVVGKNNITTSAVIISKIFKIPLIVELVNYTQNPNYYQPLLLNLFLAKSYRENTLIICISKYLEKLCRQHKIYNTWHRPNPVDEEIFNLNYNSISKKELFGFNEKDKVILQLAKFMPLKNQTFMLNVLENLPNEYKLVLVGPVDHTGVHKVRDLNYINELKDMIDKLKLNSRILLDMTFTKTPEKFMKACDVFVIPSKNEGLSTVMLEALSCGKPVITNKLGSVFDIWIDEKFNGKTVELNAEKWASEILKIINIPKKNLQISSKKILDVASTETIDLEYYKRMRRLIN